MPVWTGVHSEKIAAHSPDRWKHALCALGDDARDLPTLRWAAEFAKEQKLDVRLVHAVTGSEGCEKDNPSLSEFLFGVARERIDKLQAEAGTDFEVCLHRGKVSSVVCYAAVGHVSDIVIIGRGVIQEPFGRFRSGVYDIVREAPCPVISV